MAYYPPETEFKVREIRQQPKGVRSLDMREIKRKKKKRFSRLKYAFLVIFLLAALGGGYFLYQTGSAFDKMTGQSNSLFKSIIKMLPLGENVFSILPIETSGHSPVDDIRNNKLDRLNVLLLGYRGVDDPNGGLLTDTMMIASLKPKTGEVALISVPRDLYVSMPNNKNEKAKINEAYAHGMKSGNWKDALAYSKESIEEVTGLDIHYVASIDFEAFKEIIDTMGGITIYLDKPFSEQNQFMEGSIYLPAGKNTIGGEKALLFARARFSSSDFERAKRQQQILVGVKEKALTMGILSNPVKIVSIMDSLGNHVRTNAELWEIKEMAGYFKDANSSNVKRKVFDTTPEGLLYQSHSAAGAYILLPEGGSYNKIQEACRNIFD